MICRKLLDLLYPELFDSRCDDVSDDAAVFVKLHGEHVLQREGVWVHLKPGSCSCHQHFPVPGTNKRRHVEEFLHVRVGMSTVLNFEHKAVQIPHEDRMIRENHTYMVPWTQCII